MNSPTNSLHWPALPKPLRTFFAKFPLHTYPPIRVGGPTPVTGPTLWILPPANTEADSDLLSADVECLKWQAYLALRGLRQVQVRWDIHADGAIDAHLPNLHVPAADVNEAKRDAASSVEGQLLAAGMIPEWADSKIGVPGELEGYVNTAARDESRAWVSLLEGHVHKMLVRVCNRGGCEVRPDLAQNRNLRILNHSILHHGYPLHKRVPTIHRLLSPSHCRPSDQSESVFP